MKSDIERWNAKYDKHKITESIEPDPILLDHRSLLQGNGNALDLAAGKCDNALFLAVCGYDSFAIDASYIALHLGKKKAACNEIELNCLVADLDSYPLPKHQFDVVVVVRYLNRSLIEAVKQTLGKGGLLFFKTFNKRFLEQKPSFPPEYVLEDGELSTWFRSWNCIDSNDGKPTGATQSYWVGRKT
ncbi:class I SAM-dependent methyltransferase [Pseudomonadota bacterium]